MRKVVFSKLAAQNIKKNRKFNLPYLLTGTLTAAMFYNMVFLSLNEDLDNMKGGSSAGIVLALGTIIVAIFTVIFMLYTNSFLMKRRQKEFGLYNVLGMGKRHIAKILCWETLFTALITLAAGLAIGILISKLLLMLIFKMLFFEVQFGFSISVVAIIATVLLFAAIYFLSFISNIIRLGRSKPTDLLHGGKVGESEPKTKWVLAIIGAVTMIAGYVMALSVDSPVMAIGIFFIAVILVIVGTYCLFTAGSIAILKLLRKNKKFYYKTNNFAAVSGMIYRMKRNAVGLANICVLAAMVLVTVSTTVCMYIGAEDALNNQHPNDIEIDIYSDDYTYDIGTEEIIKKTVAESGLEISNYSAITMIERTSERSDNSLAIKHSDVINSPTTCKVTVVPVSTYEMLTNKSAELKNGEILISCKNTQYDWESLNYGNTEYNIKDWLDEFPNDNGYMNSLIDVFKIVMTDEDFTALGNAIKAGADINSPYQTIHSFDLSGSDSQILDCYYKIAQKTSKTSEKTVIDENGEPMTVTYYTSYSSCRQESSAEYYALYGGLLFIGIFLGILFLMATVLIIYYKQISEGYEDCDKYDIMRKVGMTDSEVKKTIRRQILIVFFLPLFTAAIHLAGSSKMMFLILKLMNVSNIGLFAICMVATLIVFAAVYALVFVLTSKTYYRIIRTENK